MAESTGASGGVGFFGLLTILLIGLKLTGYIDWSWPWVLSPLWLPLLGFLIGAVITLIIATSIFLIFGSNKRRGW